MAEWRTSDQAAGLRRLFGVELAPTLAFSTGVAEVNSSALLLEAARTLASQGHSVLLVDEHKGPGSLASRLRMGRGADLFDIVAGDVFVSEALTTLVPGVQVLRASRAAHEFAAGEVGLADRMEAILREIRNEVAYVLIDATLQRTGLSQLVASSEQVVVHTMPQSAAIKNAYTFTKRLVQEYRRDAAQITVTHARNALEAKAVFENMRDTARRHLGLRVEYLDAYAGRRPEDVGTAIGQRYPRASAAWDMPPYSPGKRAAAALGAV